MNTKDKEFLKRLLVTFKVEAEEHIKILSTGLIELEEASNMEKRLEITESVFREAHSLKGAARAVNLWDIEAVCQAMESVFAAVKREEIDLVPELFDLLHQATDSLIQLLSDTGENQDSGEKVELNQIIEKLKKAAEGKLTSEPEARVEMAEKKESDLPPVTHIIAEKPEIPAGKSGKQQKTVDDNSAETHAVDTVPAEIKYQKTELSETVRVSTTKLIPILLQAEELLLAKLASGQLVGELKEIQSTLITWKEEWKDIKSKVNEIQKLLKKEEFNHQSGTLNNQLSRLQELLDWNQEYISSLGNRFESVSRTQEKDYHSLSIVTDTLLKDTKQLLMFPFSSVLEGFPKLVRDLSRDQDKDMELVMHGGEVEIDRRILEVIKDPLIHLVRNCIDHGIEKPDVRKRKKKPAKGLITIAIGQKNSHAEIVISDNGAGIDIDKIKMVSLKLNIISSSDLDRMTDTEALSLIFQSGVSTSPIITDISGRGLGLAIVYEKILGIGGEISFETSPDTGTIFRIILPLTLATFRGVIVRVSEQLFVLPTASVERVSRVDQQLIKTVENKMTIQLNGKAVSLVYLADVLELSRDITDTSNDNMPVIVLVSADNKIAFLVDEIVNEQEVLVKTLGKQLSRVRNVAGAAILGTGKVVLILNTLDLLKSAVNVSEVPSVPAVSLTKDTKTVRLPILVVEDSITSRTLIKGILESAGYKVTTAVDGIDAYSQLRTGEFNLVVSDVDMPRMSGFDLTAKIRGDKKFTDLPVVLVTALDSREDRERGIDVGADAYIVKSNFDQSNLLDVVKRLI